MGIASQRPSFNSAKKKPHMSKVVLDTSAILALINQEPGADRVEQSLSGAIISSVNLSEVATILAGLGLLMEDIQPMLLDLITTVDFDDSQAFIAASLRQKTKAKGLSFGDRACLALGLTSQATVLTADRAWRDLDVGVQVTLIR